jgi:hypothetical protein
MFIAPTRRASDALLKATLLQMDEPLAWHDSEHRLIGSERKYALWNNLRSISAPLLKRGR